jgi:hypothetical protein
MPNYNIPRGETFPLGIDCAGRPFGPAVAKNSPYSLICRYLSDGGNSLPGKLLLPEEAKSYVDNDVAVVSNWETYANRAREGYSAGHSDAINAWNRHKACGGPDNVVVYFSVDYDAPESDQVAINAYFQACVDYLGVQSVGVYGGYWVCKRVKEAFPGVHIWQTKAWSGSNVHPDVNLLQRIGFVTVGGVQCDVNEIRTPGSAGAWQDIPVVPAPVVPEVVVPQPDPVVVPEPAPGVPVTPVHAPVSDSQKLDYLVAGMTAVVKQLGLDVPTVD